MKYTEYQTKHRELRTKLADIREPARAKEGKDTTSFLADPVYRAIDAELDVLYSGASRDYRISDSCTVRVNFEFLVYVGVWHDTRGNLMDFTYITPDELRLVADVKELVARWVAGEAELPPSGDWSAIAGRDAAQAKVKEIAERWWAGRSVTQQRQLINDAKHYVDDERFPAQSIHLPLIWNLRLTLAIPGPVLPEGVAPADLDYFITGLTMTHCRKGHVSLLHDGIWTCITCGDSAPANGKDR